MHDPHASAFDHALSTVKHAQLATRKSKDNVITHSNVINPQDCIYIFLRGQAPALH